MGTNPCQGALNLPLSECICGHDRKAVGTKSGGSDGDGGGGGSGANGDDDDHDEEYEDNEA